MRFDDVYDIKNIPVINLEFKDVGEFFKKYKSLILKNTVLAIDYIIETPNITHADVMVVNIIGSNGELIMDMDIHLYADDIYDSTEKLMNLAIELEEYEVAGRIKKIEEKLKHKTNIWLK